ncbi:hypothetical protein OH809_38505 [Streptomyces sp. NBC_00873]|uniref:hypothetical protein n=1 Tax=unclassified Streptomyces TaxID=2593676 RepID=UPI003868D6AA|nr:hypothetical protein OH809_38505 [Streptomyces sp. NBC_00873]WTA42097.1 hypothetical protein OH821_05205 [Streptomyces sp. NBC_00842]
MRNRLSKGRTLGMAALTAFALLASSGNAHAITWEEDVADLSAQKNCSLVSLSGWTDAFSCFQKYGDVLQVYTAQTDTVMRMSVQWRNEIKKKDGGWELYRYGECFNDLGTRTFGVCNKDFYENSTVHNGYQGSRISIKHCIKGTCEPWSVWALNDA